MQSITRRFAQYVSLNIAGMIGLSCYILADTFFVAKALGTAGLAALNLSISLFSVLQGVGLMLGIGGATRFSISRSEGNDEKSASAFLHALLGGAVFAALFLAAGLFFAEPLSALLGADAVTLPYTSVYIRTIYSFSPFFLLNNILLAFVRNDGNPRLSMAAMLMSSFSNIVLDYVFMFPLSMGIFGAAFATGLSPVISLAILSLHFLRGKSSLRLKKCRIRLAALRDIGALGFSSLITELASAVALITFNLLILGIAGNTGVAAYGVVANIALIVTAIFVGVAQGVQPLTSDCFGRGDRAGLGSVLRCALLLTAVLSVALYGVLFLFAEPVVAAFNSEGDPVLAAIAGEGMRIYFIGYFFAGVNIVASAFLSAVTRYKSAMLISVLRSCALIVPLALLLGWLLQMTGVWLAFVVTELLVLGISAFCLWRFRRAARQ